MDEQAKKAVLRKIDYGLFVVGAADGERVDASTVNWLTQCSFKPPLLALAVKQGTALHELISAGRVFTVSFLGKEQKDLAEHFVRPVSQVGDKLTRGGVRKGATGAPILGDALGYVECRVREIVTGGDHDVVIGEVVEAGLSRDEPMLELSDTGWHYGG